MSAVTPPRLTDTARTSPVVWIKKLVLYKSINPNVEIRQIKFTTGLNIIQGESNETEEAFQSGHGIGKTTVCRLIRYCLGEKTFGQSHVVTEVGNCFPDGYVGAEIELGGVNWSVLLPLGRRTKRFAAEGAILEDLQQSDEPKRYEDFTKRLSDVVLVDAAVNEVLTGEQTLLWLHVLGMCSRDQESRYDRYWNWREKRSDSGTQGFDKPKVDAGLCLRAILGLLDSNEPKLRLKLDGLEASHRDLHEQIRREKTLPAAHITSLRNRLKIDFGVLEADEAPLDEDLFSLKAEAGRRLREIDSELQSIDDELLPLNRRISLTAASIMEPEELAEQLEAASEVTAEGTDTLLQELQELQRVRQFVREAEVALCRYGRVLIGQCSYVQDRTQLMDQEIRERQLSVLPTASEREQAAARLVAQAQRQRSLIEQIQRRLDDMGRERDNLIEQRRNLRIQADRIPGMLNEIQDWNEVLEGRKQNTTIQKLEDDIKEAEASRTTSKEQLATLIAEQVTRAKQFAERFDALVKQTLTKDFKGVVDIEEEGINFRIVRGESLAGEAYETLAILLADVALMLESQYGHSRHPGLLIHDSPREADLNLGIYRKLLDKTEEQLRKDRQQDEVPFQYIVTTTTLPSRPLRKKAITKAKLKAGPGSLFKMQLELGSSANVAPLFD